MGKQAKLKRLRKQSPELSLDAHKSESFDETQFVQKLEMLGYSQKQIQQAPDLPNSDSSQPRL